MSANDKPLEICAECGEPIDSPAAENPCSKCVLSKSNPEYAKQRAEDLKRKALMSELGMPANALWRELKFSDGAFGEKWQGYSLELFGMQVTHFPEPCDWPLWILRSPGGMGPDLVVQLWQQRVFCNNSQFFAEVRWNPTQGYKVAIKGLEHSTSKRDIDSALKGLRLIRTAQQTQKGGRNIGSTELSSITFIELSREAARRLGKEGLKLTKPNLAKQLQISRSTVYNYLRKHKDLWPLIRIEYDNARAKALTESKK